MGFIPVKQIACMFLLYHYEIDWTKTSENDQIWMDDNTKMAAL